MTFRANVLLIWKTACVKAEHSLHPSDFMNDKLGFVKYWKVPLFIIHIDFLVWPYELNT